MFVIFLDLYLLFFEFFLYSWLSFQIYLEVFNNFFSL